MIFDGHIPHPAVMRTMNKAKSTFTSVKMKPQLTFKWLETKRPSQMHSDHSETNIFSQMKLWRCIRNTPFGKERSLCNSQKFWLQQLLTGGLLLELGAVVRGRQGVDLRWSILHTRTLQLSRIYMDFSNTCQSFGS